MENENKSRVQLMNDLFNEPERPRQTSQNSQTNNQGSRQVQSSRVNSVQPSARVSRNTSDVRPRSSSSQDVRRSNTNAESSRSRAVSVSPDEVTPVTVSRRSGNGSASGQSRNSASNNAPVRKSGSNVSRSGSNTRTTSPNRMYSDIVEERKNKNSNYGKTKKKSKKKSKKSNGFKKFIIVYSAILLVIIIVGTIILNSFLVAYEAAQPANVMKTLTAELSQPAKVDAYLDKNESKIIVPAGVLDYKTAVSDKLSGKTIDFIQNEKYTPTSPSYNLKADGVTVAEVNLKQGSEGSFGLKDWEIGSIDVTKCFGDTKTYSILVPEGSKVYLNGVELDSSYITGTDVPADLKNSVQYMAKPPVFTIYQVSTVTDAIDISGTDASGAPLVFSSNNNSYVAGGKASDEFIASVKGRVEAALEEYALYFIYMAFNLSDYILEGSELYKYIFGGDEYDPINPWLYMWEDIESYSFSLFDVSNFIKYSDDCFTVDVKYHLDMSFTDPTYKDDNQEIDATWVWVKNGDNWYLTDSIVH